MSPTKALLVERLRYWASNAATEFERDAIEAADALERLERERDDQATLISMLQSNGRAMAEAITEGGNRAETAERELAAANARVAELECARPVSEGLAEKIETMLTEGRAEAISADDIEALLLALDQAEAKLQSAEQRAEAAERDAARYRFLRDATNRRALGLQGLTRKDLYLERFDTAIDAAIAARQP